MEQTLTHRKMKGTCLHHACYRLDDEGLNAAVDLLLPSRADETTVSITRKTQEIFWNQFPLTGAFVPLERTQLLLARAPNDSAWRRPCGLVMLSFRAPRTRTAGCNNGGGSGDGSNDSDRQGESGSSKIAGDESAEVGRAGNGCAIGSGGEGGVLGAMGG